MMNRLKSFFNYYKVTIISVIFLAVLVIAYFLLNSIQEYNIPNESNDSSKIESFYKDERENIKSIFVSNSTGEYKFTYKDGRWVVDGNEEIEIQQQKVEEFAYSMTFFDGIFITDDVSDLEQFGLSVPQATISITRINDEVVTFYLGNKTHTSTGYYMKTSLNNRIYEAFIGKGEKFLLPLGSFRIQEFFRLDSSQLRSIAISGKTNGEIFIKAKDEVEDISLSGWLMTKPFYKDVYNQTLGNLIIDKLSSPILVNEYVEENPKSLSPYGLDDPAQTVTFDVNGIVTKILFGNEVGNEVYVKKDGQSTVYKINKEPFDFRMFDAFTFIDKLAYTVKLADLSSFTISSDKDYIFEITGEGANTVYKLNGRQIEVSQMRSFYETLSMLSIRGVITEPVTNTQTIMIKYNLKNGDVNILGLIPYKDRFYAASINGKREFYVHKTDVENILNQLRDIERNQ